jgi:hypothetical protein
MQTRSNAPQIWKQRMDRAGAEGDYTGAAVSTPQGSVWGKREAGCRVTRKRRDEGDGRERKRRPGANAERNRPDQPAAMVRKRRGKEDSRKAVRSSASVNTHRRTAGRLPATFKGTAMIFRARPLLPGAPECDSHRPPGLPQVAETGDDEEERVRPVFSFPDAGTEGHAFLTVERGPSSVRASP